MIDRDYRGNVGVVLFNLGQTDYQVHQGDRVAQLVIEKICTPELVEVEVCRGFDFIHWEVTVPVLCDFAPMEFRVKEVNSNWSIIFEMLSASLLTNYCFYLPL